MGTTRMQGSKDDGSAGSFPSTVFSDASMSATTADVMDAMITPVVGEDAAVAPSDASPNLAADGGTRRPLARPEEWVVTDALHDPFGDRPADADCASTGYMPEVLSGELVFSVDTGLCSYLTATQPSLLAVEPDSTFFVRVWHFALTAPEDSEAHVAIRIGDHDIVNRMVPIPAPGGLLVDSGPIGRSFPAGTPVYFHLHNHGDNSWSFIELSVE
jgi:hypothetical protein